MDHKAADRTRKSSIQSSHSVRFASDVYRPATERHQRQAETSLLTEGRRPSRPPLIHEESIEPTFLQDFFSREKSVNITSLSRADSYLSPLEAHPGHRLRGFSITEQQPRPEDVSGEYSKPFPEPTDVEWGPAEQRYSSIRRVDTASLNYAYSRIQRSASDAKEQDRNVFRRLYYQMRGRRAVKPGALSGIELMSSLATVHASSILSGRSAALHDRRVLYVLEFFRGDTSS